MSRTDTPFLSFTSANALISDLRPATLSPVAHQLLNAFIDEVLFSLIRHADSLNPSDLRASGVPAVFSGDKAAGESTGPRTLGRAAVGEAELELRSWLAGRPRGAKKGFDGGQGNGAKRGGTFPARAAGEFMRVKCASYSTLAPQDGVSKQVEDEAYNAWEAVGGDLGEETIGPASLWLTAILEFLAERVLGKLSQVIARDSRVSTAGPQELYVALCEDESVWGFFKRMEVRAAIEEAAVATRTRKISNQLHDAQGSSSAASSPRIRRNHSPESLNRRNSLDRSVSSAGRGSTELPVRSGGTPVPPSGNDPTAARYGVGIAGGPSAKDKNRAPAGLRGHNRSSSGLSMTTKSIISAFNDQFDIGDRDGRSSPVARARSPLQDDTDDFDAMMASGETKKISLTPSRLKTFDMSPGRKLQPTTPSRPGEVRKSMSPEERRLSSSRSYTGVTSRTPSSARRMEARGPTTIEEADDDGNEADSSKGTMKESLAELLASEPPRAGGVQRSVSAKSPDGERTAPAIILGTPPPPDAAKVSPNLSVRFPSPATKSEAAVPSPPKPVNGPTLNRPERTPHLDDDDEQQMRKKTSAQELADFLNSTAPPPPSQSGMGADEPNGAAFSKTSKLRGLMSKMGRKRSDDRGLPPLLPPSASARSLGPPVQSNLWSQSRPISTSAAPEPMFTGSVGSGKLPVATQNDGHTAAQETALGAIAGAAGASIATALDHAPLSRAVEQDSVPEVTAKPSPIPAAALNGSSASNLTDYSDAKSFATAEEPTASQDAIDVSQPPAKDSAAVVGQPAERDQPESTASDRATTQIGVTHEQLAQLPRVLQHATTVAECRILVGAMLAQWGVSSSGVDGEGGHTHVEPETRVLGWLLGGADGPVAGTNRHVYTQSSNGQVPAEQQPAAPLPRPLKGLGISQGGVPA